MKLHQFSIILGLSAPDSSIVDLMFETGPQQFKHVRVSLYEYIHDNPERRAAMAELLEHLQEQASRA